MSAKTIPLPSVILVPELVAVFIFLLKSYSNPEVGENPPRLSKITCFNAELILETVALDATIFCDLDLRIST